MATRSFEELEVWKKAHMLVLEIYKATQVFPKEELFGITTQIRRSAISIPANIAEGYKRLSKNEKIRFFNIAQSSLEEVKYYLLLTQELNIAPGFELQQKSNEIGKMLDIYIKRIRESK